MKYSVIIPVYNAEKTLNRCVDSILNQKFKDYEIILVNDGSADKSLELCRAYSDKYSNIVTVDKINGGASSARNAGLEIAQGEYILFVDSDDYVQQNYFDEFEKFDLKNGLLVYTNKWKRNGTDELIQRQISNDMNDKSLFEQVRYLIDSRTVNGPYPKKFSRKLIEQNHIRFDVRMPVAEDFIFCLSYLFLCDEVKIFNTSVYINDQTDMNTLSRGKKKNLINIYPVVFDRAFDLISNSSFTENQKQELYRIWDRLHVESFGTCVMEEFKEDKSSSEIRKEIKKLCEIFYSKYKGGYGYSGIIHRAMRICIKYKLSTALYIFGKLWVKKRGF